jgi:hypothetical protein
MLSISEGTEDRGLERDIGSWDKEGFEDTFVGVRKVVEESMSNRKER